MQTGVRTLLRLAQVLCVLACGVSCTLVNSRAGLAHDDDRAGGAGGDGGTSTGRVDAGDDGWPSPSDGGSPDAGQGGFAPRDADTGPGGEDAKVDATEAGSPDVDPLLFEGLFEPRGLTVHGGEVCFVAGYPRSLYCAPKDGSEPPRDITVNADRPFLTFAFDIALDDQYVYWSNGSGNQVLRRTRSGGTPQEYFTGTDVVSYIALRSGTVFATDYRGVDAPGNVVFGPFSGRQSMLIYPNETGAAGIAVVDDTVFWGARDRLIFGPDRGNASTVKVPTDGNVAGLAVDGQRVAYFVTGNQRLYKLLRGSNAPELLYDAGAPFGESDVALDDEWVYWTERDNGLLLHMRR